MKTKACLFAVCVAAVLSSSAHAHGPRWRPSFYFGVYPAPVYAAPPVYVGPPRPVLVAPGPGPVYLAPPPVYIPPPGYYYPPPAPGVSFYFR